MIFSYQARAGDGSLRTGTIEAATAQEAAVLLRGQGLLPLRFQKQGPSGEKNSQKGFWARLCAIGTVSLSRKALFFRQLAVTVNAGIPLGSALSDLAAAEDYHPLAHRIELVSRHVDSGHSLSEALGEGQLATAAERPLLAAGEESGRLGEALELLAHLCERRVKMRGRIASAMVYPGFVLFFSAVVLVVMFQLVLPKFDAVFARMNMEMPPLTAALFKVSRDLPRLLLWTAAVSAALVLLWHLSRRSGSVRFWTDRFKLRLPLIGKALRCAALSRGFRSLATMLSSGVPLLRALELAQEAAGNAAVAQGFFSLHEAALEGRRLATAAGQFSFFRPVALQLITAGEKTGSLDQMLFRSAEWYENDLEECVKRLGAALEPILVLFVGGVAAVVTVGLFAPVLKAVQELSTGL